GMGAAASDVVRKGSSPPLPIRGWRPPWPFFLAADGGPDRPSLSVFAHDRAVANRLTFGEHVVDVACVGINQDRAWRFLAVISNDLTPIGGRNPRLPGGRVRQVLPVARRGIGGRHGASRRRHAAEQPRQNILGRGGSHGGE